MSDMGDRESTEMNRMAGGNGGDMPGGSMDGPNGSPLRLEDRIERSVGQFVDDIVEKALAEVNTKQERGLVKQALAQELRTTLYSLAEQEAQRRMGLMATNGGNGHAMAIGDAVGAGVTALKSVKELGFVEFTQGLVTGTFDAIISATVKQMDAYAKLVADLAKTLEEFQAENVTDAEINAHLAGRYPDGQGGTSVRAGFTFTATPANPDTGALAKTANEKFQDVVDALVAETRSLSTPLTRGTGSLNIPADNTTLAAFTAAQVTLIRTAIGATIARSMIEHLRAMAREGMARIVITNGEILSKLTFNVTATDVQSKQASQRHQDSFGISVNAKAGWGWGSASVGANYQQMNVRTVNESSFDSVTMSAEIIGQVKLQFKTETFPPITTG